MNTKTNVLVFVIIIQFLLLILCFSNKKVKVVEKYRTDTITNTRIDTFKAVRDTFIYETIIDTQYIEKIPNKGLELVFTQKYYHNDKYSAWVSGYKPSLDSIKTYNSVVTKTITNEVYREVYPKRTDFYINFGTLYINNRFAPNIGASIKFKNDLVIGSEFGIYDNKPYYGLKFGYKL